MRHITLAVLILVFGNCSFINAQSNNSNVNTSTKKSSSQLFIKDKSKYSKEFIAQISASNYPKPIRLIDNYIIVGQDTSMFPNDLDINKEYRFRASKVNQSYNLNVKRINETTLKFDFNLYKNGSLVFSDKGEAHIGSSFYLASEMDVDNKTGKGYPANEYTKQTKDSWFSIRIETGKVDKKKLRAKILFGSNDKSRLRLELDNCPALLNE